MSEVKVVYKDLIEFLKANEKKQVSTLMPQILEMVSGKSTKTFKVDDAGNVTHVFCYYHKEWEDVREVEYGQKAGTATGLNTMCKQGVSNWTKQQRVAKQAKEQLLNKLIKGEISVDQLPVLQAEIEEARMAIVERA